MREKGDVPNSMAIKKWQRRIIKVLHFLLTFYLLGLLFIWSIKPLQHYLFPPQERLYLQKEIFPGLWLYEVLCSKKTTDEKTYNYYFAGEIKDNPIKRLNEEEPFLIGNRGDAEISLIEVNTNGQYPHLLLKYSGKIFEFYNMIFAPYYGYLLLDLEASFPTQRDYKD